jgi:hypothetical protein
MRGVADAYDAADLAVVSGFMDRMAAALDPE